MEGEIKERIPVWLYPSTIAALDEWKEKDNCKSRSEFLEKAIQFYSGYLSAQIYTDYLPLAITSALSGMVDSSENRISRLLFKLTVELSMLMNLYAAQNDIDEEVLRKLRTKCLSDVKKTNGKIQLEDVVEYQQGNCALDE